MLGVQGIGQQDSKIAVYETDEEERGVLAVEDVTEEDLLFIVPLRLALQDREGPGSKQDASWYSRLATRLLQERQEPASSWQPYIQVLPASGTAQPFLPSPEAVATCGVALGQLAPSLLRRLEVIQKIGSTAASAGSSTEEVLWALQVVQSRTLGASAKNQEVVRMLLPLVDMLNHRGDEALLLPSQSFTAQDNARWDLVELGGQWHMQVTATRPISSGEEVFLSYEERENEYFFVQYGFVPPQNPHDAVELFASAAAAEAWCQQQETNGTATSATSMHMPAEAPEASVQLLSLADQHLVSGLQLHTRARLDPQLVRILNEATEHRDAAGRRAAGDTAASTASPNGLGARAAAAGPDVAAANGRITSQPQLDLRGEQLLLKRCWQLLHEGVTTLQHDLGLLAADESCDDVAAEAYVRLLQHYRQAIAAVQQHPGVAELQAASPGMAPAGVRLACGCLPQDQRLVLQLVSHKKMILWDAVLSLVQAAPQ